MQKEQKKEQQINWSWFLKNLKTSVHQKIEQWRDKVWNGRKYLQITYFKGLGSNIYIKTIKFWLLSDGKKKKNPVLKWAKVFLKKISKGLE